MASRERKDSNPPPLTLYIVMIPFETSSSAHVMLDRCGFEGAVLEVEEDSPIVNKFNEAYHDPPV